MDPFEEPLPQRVTMEAAMHGLDAVDLSFVLLPREICSLNDFVERYERVSGGFPAHKDPDLICFLGDNGCSRGTWSAVSRKLPTARTNIGLMWSPYRRRWVSSRKLLCSCGIPQRKEHFEALGLSESDAAAFQFRHLHPSHRKRWAGNCVHAAMAGVFIACCLSSMRYKL